MEGRICTGCGVFKVLDDFYKQKQGKYSRTSKCKICIKIYRDNPKNKQRKKEWEIEYYKDPEHKQRKKEYNTKYYKDPEHIQKRKEWEIDYYKDPNVIQKIKERKKEYYKDLKVKQRLKEYRDNPENKQREKKRYIEYYKDPEYKQKIKIKGKEYYKDPNVKQRIKEYQKKYLKDPEIKNKNKERSKEYRNKPENKQRKKEWTKKQYKDPKNIKKRKDPLVKLRKSISGFIYQGLKSVNLNKTPEGCMKYIDYTMEELKKHIENQFENWMTWKNQGTTIKGYWQIDHIIPSSLYDWSDEEEIRKCWNLRNLRPLCSITNVSKYNNLIPNLIKKYQIKDLLPKEIYTSKTSIGSK